METPFIYSTPVTSKRYHTWDYHLKQKFGGKVFKVSLDGGFSCPNIDGTRGIGGCTYCSYAQRRVTPDHLLAQFAEVKAILHKKWPVAQYIPYFQANTSTYAPLEELKEKYELMLAQPGVVGLAIATRADALPPEVVEYLAQLNKRTYLIVELGLQTIHDCTAEKINRGHSYEEFLIGYERLVSRGIPVCVHIINGLPGEDKTMMVETMQEVARLPHLHSVKIHLLHVIAGTPLAQQYINGEFAAMTMDDYVDVVCDQLELLPAEVIIQRITGDGLKDSLLAPRWSLKKFIVMNAIDKELIRRGTYQGYKLK